MNDSLRPLAKRARRASHVLVLMRHAKAEPLEDAPGGRDIDRGLVGKGRRQASRVADGLDRLGLVPDRILCSGAVRARQTLEGMLPTFGDGPVVDYRRSLYDGGFQDMLDQIVRVPDGTRTLMVLAHEPTVSMAAQRLAGDDSDPHCLDLIGLGMPTATVAILVSDKGFPDWTPGGASLIGVLRPKDMR